MIYIGIDIAKNSHVASAVNSDGSVFVAPFSFSNTKDGFELFLSKFKNLSVDNCLIGLEATGHYSDPLVNFLASKNYKIGIINPIQTDALRNANIRKTKTDKIDTFLIAKCLILGDYTLFTKKDFNIIQLRTLTRFRFDIIQSRTKLKTQLTGCIDTVFPELHSFFNGNLHLKSAYAILLKFTSPQCIAHSRIDTIQKTLFKASRGAYSYDKAVALKDLAIHSIGIYNPAKCFQIKNIIKQIELLNSQIDDIDCEIELIMKEIDSKILTIPGIGYNLGSTIISEIGNISRFSNWTKLLAYAGLDPSVKQSGNFASTNTRISKRGSKHLRYAITQAASIIIFNNDTFHNYYITLRAKGKSYRNAIGHVSGKLVRIIFHILTKNTSFNLS